MEEGFKEFQGKDLDSAIASACEYFAARREQLEIEILQDAKSGIFGIVGVRKAKLRARRVHLRETAKSLLSQGGNAAPADEIQKKRQPRAQPKRRTGKNRPTAPISDAAGAAGLNSGQEAAGAATGNSVDSGPTGLEEEAKPFSRASDGASPAASDMRPESGRDAAADGREAGAPADARPEAADDLAEARDEEFPKVSVRDLDPEKIRAVADRTMRELVRPIVGTDVRIAVGIDDDHVRVDLDCAEDSGLLIGRDGLTLTALQYLLSRIISRSMGGSVLARLDIDGYRKHQEERLRQMALALAERVRQTGRSSSTRPLSSYNRRIVHLCLRDAGDVQTRSIGDGAMKRVVISRRRPENGERPA